MGEENRAMPGRAMIRLAAALIALWGFYQLLAGLYFLFLRPSFLPEDLRASGTTLESVRDAAPGIEAWLRWVFAVLGGQMAALGALVLGGAINIWRGRPPNGVELVTYALGGALSVVLMSGVNFAIGSDFRWLLLAPVAIWLAGGVLLRRLAR